MNRSFGEALKAARGLRGNNRYLLAPSSAAWEWIATLGAAGAVALVYFWAARLGLALLSASSDVAVFWPASGIAAGILIVAGRRAYPVLVIGVVVGTVAANVMSDRSPLTSLLKGFCNSGEAVLVAWLLEQWFGRPFRFGDLPRLAGFLAAVVLAAAASATGGAATMTLLHRAAPYWDVWRAWFLSDWVGIVVVAPLVIGLREVWREQPSLREWTEGVGVLTLTALVSIYTVSRESGSWISFSPGALVLPLLLWLTARCPPAFGRAGAFIASAAVILATTLGVGRFGDATVPLIERVRGAQTAVTTVTLYTLILIALFAQRKEAEKELRESEAQLAKKSSALARLHEISSQLWHTRDLHQALDEILAGAMELLGADMGAIRIWDSTRGALRIEAHRGFTCEYLDLFRQIPVESTPPCENVMRSGERMVIEDVEQDYRFAPFRPLARAAGYRALQSTRILSREGAPLGVLGTHFRSVHKPAEQDLSLLDLYVRQAADIIDRHKAEDALRESEERLRERDAQLALAGRAALVGYYVYDVNKGTMQVSEGYAAINGLPEGTTETSISEWRARVHPEDLARAEGFREQAFADRRKEDNAEYRIVLSTGEVRWIERRGSISYQEDGRPERVVGVNIDVTEHKQAELALAERNTQLELASKSARVGSLTVDFRTALVKLSPGCAAILGLPESTIEMSTDDANKFVHPEDLASLELQRHQVLLKQQREFVAQFRIHRANDGEIRWIEARSHIFYDQGGKPEQLIGVRIDFTDRKRAADMLAERNLQLELAGKVGRVGSYTYDVRAAKLQVSEGYAVLFGLPEGTTETTLNEWRARVHPEDLGRVEGVHEQAVADKRREYSAEYRIVRSDGEVRWTERRCFISYDGDARPQRVVGVSIDITERKRAEEAQKLLNAELDHRVKNALATVSAVVSHTRQGSGSVANFVAALEGRIRSMATTQELLSACRWQGISLTELVRCELAPYATSDNTKIDQRGKVRRALYQSGTRVDPMGFAAERPPISLSARMEGDRRSPSRRS
jgi:PAS domain S-box-containing protein